MSDEHRISDHRWESFSDEFLADVIDDLNQGLGPAAIAEPVAALQSISERLYEIDTTLHDKLGELGVIWQTPQSSDLAKAAMQESGRYAGRSADGMALTVGAMERQADTFARVRDNLPNSQALRGSGNSMSMFELAGTGMGALTAHGHQDASEAQRRQQEVRARAIDALRGYNKDTNDSLGEHQPLPSPEPTRVDRSPVPSYTATNPIAAPTVGGGGDAPGFGAPQVTQTGPSSAAPVVGTESSYPAQHSSYGQYRTAGDAGVPPGGGGSYQSGSPGSGGGAYRGTPAAGPSAPGAGNQGGVPRGGAPTAGGTGGGVTGGADPRTGYAPQSPGGGGPLADGGRTGVGAPGQGRPAGLGGTAYAARYRALSGLASNEAAMGSAVAAGAAGAGMAGGTAEPDRLAKGRGAPGGSRDSFDEEFAEPAAPEGIIAEDQDASTVPPESAGPIDEIPPERLPMTEPSTGDEDPSRVRRFGTESEDLFEGPRVSKPVLGEFDAPEPG